MLCVTSTTTGTANRIPIIIIVVVVMVSTVITVPWFMMTTMKTTRHSPGQNHLSLSSNSYLHTMRNPTNSKCHWTATTTKEEADMHHHHHHSPALQQCYLFPKLHHNDHRRRTVSSLSSSIRNRTTTTNNNNNNNTQTHHHRQATKEENDYVLGQLLPSSTDGIRLSQGLIAKVIATSGKRVQYTSPLSTQRQSWLPFHRKPDGADIFTILNTDDNDTTTTNDGQYVYMSNSERNIPLLGGVYGIVFDVNHQIVSYRNDIRRTTRNCNGGRTPWDSWITCEEAYLPIFGGNCWQIDPQRRRRPQRLTMSGGFFRGGTFEAFAYDDRASSSSSPSFYITEDSRDGTLRRYRPPPNTPMGWDMLHIRTSNGSIIDYLEFIPQNNTFRWTTNINVGRKSASMYYRNSEGIAIHNGTLAFVSKVEQLLFLLQLDTFTYTAVSTATPTSSELTGGGSIDAQPDHVIHYAIETSVSSNHNNNKSSSSGSNATTTNTNLLFISEDGGPTPGLFAYDGTDYLSIFESEIGSYTNDEVTGIAFSPDGRMMYACLQDAGKLFQISRMDQQPFTNRRTLKWRKGLKL